MRQRFESPKKIDVDSEIVERARHGDSQAFSLLVQKYQFRLLKLVSRYVTDPSEAMDVTQESFIKAFRALEKFRGESAFYTWLYRIAINTAKNYVISQARRLLETDVELVEMEVTLTKANLKDYSTPEKVLLDVELGNVINEAIQHLPKELRLAITLRELEGLTYEEIAQRMSCPIGTVRSRIYRAREAIERRLKPLLNE